MNSCCLRKREVISPFDSGSWSGFCKHFFEVPKASYGHNCSAYAGRAGLGTFQALDHLFGLNEAYWNSSEAFLKPLARLLGDASYQGEDLVKYFEAPGGEELSFSSWQVLPLAPISLSRHIK